MSGFAEYEKYDGLGLAELVRTGQVTASELLDEAIARVESLNPALNAVIHPFYDKGRARAKAKLGGPFAGVPFLVKDLLQCVPGVPLEMGCRFWKGNVAKGEGTLYRRWLDAGVVPFAKTTTPELGILPSAEAELVGPTHNPWALERTAGGSSGGSGAAVGARIVPLASGGDGGGSIRIPSSCCGIFGIKPTRARTPAGPYASEGWGALAVEHVLTLSVRDSAAMLDATHGLEVGSIYGAPPVDKPFLHAAQSFGGKLRIGFHVEPPFPATVHADCKAAVQDAAKLCESLGHEVEEISPQADPRALSHAFLKILGAHISAEIRNSGISQGRKPRREDFELGTWTLNMLGQSITGADYAFSLEVLQAETRRLAHKFNDYDAILTPTLGCPPVELGSLKPRGLEGFAQALVARTGIKAPLKVPQLLDQAAAAAFGFASFTPVANFTGQPSMSVPLYWNQAGLPIGTMFTGRFGEEATLFSLAAQLEQARPWRDRRPPLLAGAE